jgi:hypothetical protein
VVSSCLGSRLTAASCHSELRGPGWDLDVPDAFRIESLAVDEVPKLLSIASNPLQAKLGTGEPASFAG